MNKKQNKIANLLPNLSTENCDLTLEANAKISVAVATTGKHLVKRIVSEGMDEAAAASCSDYIAACSGEVKRLNIGRKPFTTMLTEIQKKFVKIEKDIDPNVPGSPAYEIAGLLKNYKLKRLEEEQEATTQMEAARRLEKNRLLTEKRVLGRGDLTDGQKEAALKRADERLQKGQAELAIGQIETDLIPIVTAPDGYIDLLRPWWEEVGCHLPESDLGRIFHPMISYAKKQARKGILVDSDNISYVAEPKIKVA